MADSARLVSVVLLLAAFLAYGSWGIRTWTQVDRGMVIDSLEKSETKRLASTKFFDKMTAFAQATLAVLGASWTLLIVQSSRMQLTRPGLVAFVLVNISLISSLAVYNEGYDFIVGRIFYHQTFDLEAPFVVLVKDLQQVFFMIGCLGLVAVITNRRTV